MTNEFSRRGFLAGAGGLTALSFNAFAAAAPAPYGIVPSARQLRWHELEQYAFLHFTVNTFTDREWGLGDESETLFNPTAFDPAQIMRALKAGGMRAVILTCKHHDGFCLWPTRTTTHNITKSPWRNGKGDMVREIANAARAHGLKFGVYLSPWDRNTAKYGKPEYIEMYRAQLRELLTGYGEIFEVWHDGANGGDGYYGGAKEKRTIDKRTYYDWPRTWELVRQLQPNAVIFSDIGPDLRWVGNEKGIAGETCWATYKPVAVDGGAASPGDVREAESPIGTRNAGTWMPAECDVSIRPGWFWHEAENAKVRTPRDLMDLYYASTGRGGSFLLNVPPDRRGLIHEADVAALTRFGSAQQATFAKNLAVGAQIIASHTRAGFAVKNLFDGRRDTYWSTVDGATASEVELRFRSAVRFDLVRVREAIQLGQRVDAFAVDVWSGNDWKQIAEATSIGACRILHLKEPVETTRVRLRITKAAAPLALSELGLYLETGL